MRQKQIRISEEVHKIVREQAFKQNMSMRKVVDRAVQEVYED
jgi:predicted HicB family RNase H-like nuclease